MLCSSHAAKRRGPRAPTPIRSRSPEGKSEFRRMCSAAWAIFYSAYTSAFLGVLAHSPRSNCTITCTGACERWQVKVSRMSFQQSLPALSDAGLHVRQSFRSFIAELGVCPNIQLGCLLRALSGKPRQPSLPFWGRSEGHAPNLALGRTP